MMTPKTPYEALWAALFTVHGRMRSGPGGKPGECIERCGPKVRELLKELKSEDIRDVRVDTIPPRKARP